MQNKVWGISKAVLLNISKTRVFEKKNRNRKRNIKNGKEREKGTIVTGDGDI
jgi:hypothetical protein